MSHDHDKQMRNVHEFDWSNGATNNQAKEMISYLVDKPQQAMINPLLQAKVQGQLQALNSSQSERGLVRPLSEGSKGVKPLGVQEEHGHIQVEHVHYHDSSKKDGGNDSSSPLDSDVVPRRRSVKRTPSPLKQKRPSFSSSQCDTK